MGKTMIAIFAFLYMMYYEPKDYLWAFPDDRLLERWWNPKLVALLKANPILMDQIRKIKFGTLEYVGGQLEVGLSSAPNSLSSFTAKCGFLDEVDKMWPQPDADSIFTSVESRGSEYGEMFKLIGVSTPYGKAGSDIFKGFKGGSQFMFELPCYHRRCRHHQILTDETLEDGKLHCCKCGRPWTDPQRREMIEDPRAEWVSRNPDFQDDYRSYYINAFYSPVPLSFTLGRAPGDPRGYSSQILGWPFEDEMDQPPEAEELERIFTPEGIEEPDAVILAVDVQKDRLEYMITHWEKMFPRVEKQDNFRRQAAPLACWEELDALIDELRPDFVVIDRSTFDGTDVIQSAVEVLGKGGPRAYDLLRHRRIRLIKGTVQQGPDMITSRNDRIAQWNLNATQTKLGAHRLLNLNENGDQLISVRREGVPRNFLAQYLNERYVVKFVMGRPVAKWEEVVKGGPNETLDLMGYSLAARYELGLSYRRRPGRPQPFPILP